MIDYQKLLNKLLVEYPKEIDKIEKVVNDYKINGTKEVTYPFKKIIISDIYSVTEKVRLLKIFNYHPQKFSIENQDIIKDYLYALSHNNISGFEALMILYKDNLNSKYNLNNKDKFFKDNEYRTMFEDVINYSINNKEIYLRKILEQLSEDDLKRLIFPYYSFNYHYLTNKSIFTYIVASSDIELVKEYINYVDDINLYISDAVATSNIELVKLFLEKNADINYVPDKVLLAKLTPLKEAILHNDINMTKFLIENGPMLI